MKKSIIFAAMTLAFLLSACEGGTKTTAVVSASPAAVSPTPKSVQSSVVSKAPEASAASSYKVTEGIAKKDDEKEKYEIKYIQVTGLSDKKLEDKINSVLKDEALKVRNYYKTDSQDSPSVELETTSYKVSLLTPDLLSVQYNVLGTAKGAMHPNKLFYTTNINMKTGERIRLSDAINTDVNFVNKLLNGNFKVVQSIQEPYVKDILNGLTSEGLKIDFKNADSLDNIGTDKQSDTFTYFTPDSFGISVSVAHALGDSAQFEIKYSEIKDNIKTSNPIWKGLV